MNKHKLLSYVMLFLMTFSIILPISMAQAAPIDNVLTTLGTSTLTDQSSGVKSTNVFEKLFSFVFEKLLGPILTVFNGKSTTTNSTTNQPVVPSPAPSTPIESKGTLKGKIIVVDPGHGGSNPGAVANNKRESDNNLAVSLKLRDKLVQAGAKVIMTRDTDRTVASEGSSLGEELSARVKLAENNHADLFVSVHTNSNPDTSIIGAMTFYPNGKSSDLALDVQNELINQTGAVDKGISPATFYVLRSTSMPSILVEMGFISNGAEAALLSQDSYRSKISQGVFNGIVKYLK